MSLLQSIVICLLCAQVSSSSLEALLRRIQGEIGPATVFILGDDKAFFDNFTGFGPDIPTVVLTSAGAPSQSLAHGFHRNAILVVPVLSDRQQSYEAILPRFVSHLRVRKFVVIVASHLANFYIPFTYFHKHRFSRIFGTAGGICYAYLPYALTGQIQEIADEGPLPHAFSNLNGLSIRTDIVDNFPRAFWFPERNGRHRLGGPFGHVLDELFRKCNATHREVNISTSSLSGKAIEVLKHALTTDQIDISSLLYSPLSSVGYSYPMRLQLWGVLVPLRGFIDPAELFTRPFSPATWTVVSIAFLMLVLLDYVKDTWVRVRQNFWNSFYRMFLISIGASTPTPITSAYRFYVLVLVLAFILNNFYRILFTEYLTVSVRRTQYNTIQDLIDNNIQILAREGQRHFIGTLNYSQELEPIIKYIPDSEFYEQRESMSNTSYPFVCGEDVSNFLIRMQKVFTESRFHKTVDGLCHYHLVYLMAEYSPFKDFIDRIILQVIDSGLLEKWDRSVVKEAIRSGHRFKSSSVNRHLHQSGSPIPLNLADLSFAWSCLLMGWTLSLIVFVAEVAILLVRSRNKTHI